MKSNPNGLVEISRAKVDANYPVPTSQPLPPHEPFVESKSIVDYFPNWLMDVLTVIIIAMFFIKEKAEKLITKL